MAQVNRSLTILDLFDNDISAAGASAIGDALKVEDVWLGGRVCVDALAMIWRFCIHR